MRRITTAQPFVQHLEIVRVLSCLADPSKIRFTSHFDRDVSEIFPYLNAVQTGAIYNHAGKTLTLRQEGRLVTLHPRRVEAAKISNLEDAQRIIAWIVALINHCDSHRLDIDPNYARRDRLTVLDVVKLLPGTNCKKCGWATCLAFAAALCEEKISVIICTDLYLAKFVEKRKELMALLQASGYVVPPVLHEADPS